MQRIPTFATTLTLLLLCISAVAHGSGFIVADESVVSPHHRLSPLELRSHQVDVTINDQVAVTKVDQVFFNPSRRTVEGAYFLPVPAGGTIDRFTMMMDGTELEAEMLPAEEARRIYESIVRRMEDPGLLEYVGQGLVRIRIFPIEPNSERRVTVQFTHVLSRDHDMITYHYPLRSHRHVTARQGQFALKATVTTTQPINTIYSSSHDIDVNQPGATRAIVGMETSIEREDDFTLLYSTRPDEQDIAISLLSYRDPIKGKDADGYFLLLASPSAKLLRQLRDENIVDKDVILVLDTSGSMSGGKLDQAKRALHFVLDNLNPGDRFEIIRFSTEVESVFDQLVPADAEHRRRAIAFVDDLRPRGMTAIDDALRTAVRIASKGHKPGRPSVVIFLTDGLPTIGVRDPKQIINNVTAEMGDINTRIFCFGIGADVNTRLLDHIAENTNAFSQYVLANEDLEMKLSSFYAKISDPVLTNVAIAIAGDVRLNRNHPGALPDLFAGDQLVVLGRYRGHGEVAIRLTGTVNGEERSYETIARFAAEPTPHDFVPRLWAVRRIGFLLEQMRLHGENAEARDEITQLAREYGIVSPYTSYLILEDEAQRNVPMAQRSVQMPARREPGAGDGRPPSEEEVMAERLALREQFREYQHDVTGDEAVRVSQATAAMRHARNIDSVQASNVYSMRGRNVQMQQARYVAGRAFFQNGDLWVDSLAQALADEDIVRVDFNSDEYYELVERHPEARPWLALGRNVQFVMEGRIYDIRERRDGAHH
jgi:Ca-activated chloride channel homolog